MSWNQLGTTITGENAGGGLGSSVSLSSDGTTLAIGAPGVSSSKGQVSVYKRNPDGISWSTPTVATGSNNSDRFGSSVSLSSDGTTLAIGATRVSSFKGQVSVSKYNGTSWTSPTVVATGSNDYDSFGSSVSLSSDGTTLAIGGGTPYTSGKALVYKYTPPAPTISSVLPISGSVGMRVTIRGTNLTGASVTFGGVAAAISSTTSDTIICSTPSGPSGSVDVIVTTSGGNVTSSNAFTYPLPVSNICFPAGTPIICNQGAIAIECLNPEIHTIRGKKIIGITKTVTQDKYLVCFEKGALQENIPSKKTIISKNHSIFYKGKMMQAKEFLNDFKNVKKVKYTGEVLYNVLMEEPDKMMVNNLICETLHPENSIAKLYKLLSHLNVEEQNELIVKFNKYVIENNIYNKKIQKL